MYATALPAPGIAIDVAVKRLFASLRRRAREAAAAAIILMATVYTSAGEAHTADIFDGTTDNNGAFQYYVGWGTGTTTAAKGDTGLETASAESRVAATQSQPATDTNRFVATITSASSQTITEAALFTASTAGICVIRGDFSGIALGNGDSIEFTINLQWS